MSRPSLRIVIRVTIVHCWHAVQGRDARCMRNMHLVHSKIPGIPYGLQYTYIHGAARAQVFTLHCVTIKSDQGARDQLGTLYPDIR